MIEEAIELKGKGSMIEEAIEFAANAHAGTTRKGKKRPFILHPIEAMLIVADVTDDEEVIAAAVLHDTIEDTKKERSEIAEKFGERVASLVDSESENKRAHLSAESTWKVRKQETIDHLRTAERDVKLICLGDKLSNLREMARDYKNIREALWERFNQKDKRMHEWYYRSILEILEAEFSECPEIIEEYRTLMQTLFSA